MMRELLEFIRNPVYEEDENPDFPYRLVYFWRLLGFALLVSIIFGLIIEVLTQQFNLGFGKHAIDDFMDNDSPWFIFFAAIFLAPILEEFIFRGPLVLFKRSPYFRYIFYLFTLIFGFYHITNFEINQNTLLFSPLLVAPQLSVGIFLGFIRVKFGLVWAIGLHAFYNLVLIGPFIVFQLLDIPLK